MKAAAELARGYSHRRRTIVMIVVALAFIMNLLDVTIVNIAIPSIQQNLGASDSDIQWVISAYLLTFGTLLITGGRMGDLFGYKKLFMIGVAGFTLASLLSGVSPNSSVLIIARLLQGVMAAIMVPQVFAMMQVLYKPHERVAVSAIFGMLGGLSSTAGMIIGGLLIQADIFGWDWRPIFLINIPVGIFALIAGQRLLPAGNSTHPPKHLDYVGSGLIVASLGLLIYALVEGRPFGWPWWIFVLIVVAAALLLVFVKYEFKQFKKGFSTLLVPILFKVRTFSAGIAVMLVFAMAFIGFFFTYTLTLQIGLGFSALKTALIGIPVAIGIMISAAALGRKLLPKLGGRVMTVGAVILGIGLILIALALERYGLNTTWYELLPGLFIFGMGMGMLFAAVFAVLYNDVDPQYAGAASGLQNAVQQVAGAIGVAIVGVILFAAIKSNALSSINSVTPRLKTQLSSLNIPAQTQAAIIHNLKRCYVAQASSSDPSKTPKGCGQSAATSPIQKQIGQAAANAATKANQKNFADSFSITVYYDLALLLIAFLVSFLLPRHLKNPEAAGEAV